MKVVQEVSAKFNSVWIGWSGLIFTDAHGNKIVIACTDDQMLEIEKAIVRMGDSIREERREKAEEDVSE